MSPRLRVLPGGGEGGVRSSVSLRVVHAINGSAGAYPIDCDEFVRRARSITFEELPPVRHLRLV